MFIFFRLKKGCFQISFSFWASHLGVSEWYSLWWTRNLPRLYFLLTLEIGSADVILTEKKNTQKQIVFMLSVSEWWQWESKLWGHRRGYGSLFPKLKDGAALWAYQFCTGYQQSCKVSLFIAFFGSLFKTQTLQILFCHMNICALCCF